MSLDESGEKATNGIFSDSLSLSLSLHPRHLMYLIFAWQEILFPLLLPPFKSLLINTPPLAGSDATYRKIEDGERKRVISFPFYLLSWESKLDTCLTTWVHSTGLGANLPCILAPLGDICGSLCEAFTLADEKSLAIVFYVRDKILLLDNLLFLHSLLLPLSPSFSLFLYFFLLHWHTHADWTLLRAVHQFSTRSYSSKCILIRCIQRCDRNTFTFYVNIIHVSSSPSESCSE